MFPATRPAGDDGGKIGEGQERVSPGDGGGDGGHAHGLPVEKAVGQAVHLQALDPAVEKSRHPGDPGPGKIRGRIPRGCCPGSAPRSGSAPSRRYAARKEEERLPAEVEALDLHLKRRQGNANAPQVQTVEQPPLNLSGRRS